MGNKLLYKPPQARDLSVFSACGQEPLGNCLDGGKPYQECMAGTAPTAGDCVPVGNVFPGDPACQGGSYALVQCASGTAAP